MNMSFDLLKNRLGAEARALCESFPGYRALFEDLSTRSGHLMQLALNDAAPVDESGPIIEALLKNADIAEVFGTTQMDIIISVADDLITRLLVPRFVEPIRRIIGPITGLQGNFTKTIFVQPVEGKLFEAIDSGESVLLVTTREARRLTRSLIHRYGTAGQGRRVSIWTAGSGLFEVDGAGPATVFHPGANPKSLPINIKIERFSKALSSGAPGDPTTFDELVLHLHERGYEHAGIRGEFQGKQIEVEIWQSASERTNSQLLVYLKDVDEDGNSIDLSPESDTVLALLFSERLKRAHAKANRELCDLASKQIPQTFGLLIQKITELRAPNALYILQDAHRYLEAHGAGDFLSNLNLSIVKDANARLRRAKTGTQIVLLSADFTIPSDLTNEVLRLDLPLPGRRELMKDIRSRIRPILTRWSGAENNMEADPLATSDELVRLVNAAAGMTISDVAVSVRSAGPSPSLKVEDLLGSIQGMKKKAVKRSPVLELVETRLLPKIQLGGMKQFHEWLASRRMVFEAPDKARAAGIDRLPKGVLLLGIPGTGKSLAAKIIARDWGLPLIRLDMGSIQDKWVGSSEERIRTALSIVEAMSPCILWIDEIDKGIAQGEGHSAHSTDLNIRATILTWLQECVAPVFTVATANRFANLPPELTRAGRFDARFFFGCPNPEDRKEIFQIHLESRRKDLNAYDFTALVSATHGFTGSEIEQVVMDALYAAFADNHELTTEDILQRAKRTKPIVCAVGKGLDEAWALIDQGRLELASDSFLTHTEVLRLINPDLFTPMYCRKEHIAGWENQSQIGQRLLMRNPTGGAAAAVIDTGDPEWVFVQTNIKYDMRDQHDWKFLDTIETIESNGVFERLLSDYAIDQIIFESIKTKERFLKSHGLSGLCDIFHCPEDPANEYEKVVSE